MLINFVNAKDDAKLAATIVKANDAVIGLNINPDGSLTKEGIPQHKLYPTLKAVSFGLQRFQKQEERNSVAAVAGQAYMFRKQFPGTVIMTIHRPIYDLTPDDAFAGGLLDEVVSEHMFKSGSKLMAVLAELAEYNANKYAFSKQFTPKLLNNFLNEFPFPFRDERGKAREATCTDYFYDQVSWIDDNMEVMEAVNRTFPLDELQFDIIERDALSALILVQAERYGADELIAQMYFQANPEAARVILARPLPKSTKHVISVVNASTHSSDMVAYAYPNIKELNFQEKQIDGDPGWKNLKVACIGPRKGTSLPFETVWDLAKIK